MFRDLGLNNPSPNVQRGVRATVVAAGLAMLLSGCIKQVHKDCNVTPTEGSAGKDLGKCIQDVNPPDTNEPQGLRQDSEPTSSATDFVGVLALSGATVEQPNLEPDA